MLHTLNLGCNCITLREPCNNQQTRCDIAWLHVTDHLYHGLQIETVKQYHPLIRLINRLTPKTVRVL